MPPPPPPFVPEIVSAASTPTSTPAMSTPAASPPSHRAVRASPSVSAAAAAAAMTATAPSPAPPHGRTGQRPSFSSSHADAPPHDPLPRAVPLVCVADPRRVRENWITLDAAAGGSAHPGASVFYNVHTQETAPALPPDLVPDAVYLPHPKGLAGAVPADPAARPGHEPALAHDGSALTDGSAASAPWSAPPPTSLSMLPPATSRIVYARRGSTDQIYARGHIASLAAVAVPGSVSAVPANWGLKTTLEGRRYYFNLVTDETTWSLADIGPDGRLARAPPSESELAVVGQLDASLAQLYSPLPFASAPSASSSSTSLASLSSPSPPSTSASASAPAPASASAEPLAGWDRVRRDLHAAITTLYGAAQIRTKDKYIVYASAIVEAVRIMLYASGTARKDTPLMAGHKVLRARHRQLMASLSKLVLSAKMASGVWPAPDAVVKLLMAANDVAVASRLFVDAAREAKIDVLRAVPQAPSSLPGVTTAGTSTAGPTPETAGATVSARRPSSTTRPICPPLATHDDAVASGTASRRRGPAAAAAAAAAHGSSGPDGQGQQTNVELIAQLEGYTAVVVSTIDALVRPVATSEMQSSVLINQVRSMVTEVGNFLALVDELPPDVLNHDLTVDFKVNRLALYNSISGLVMATQTATSPFAPSNAIEEVVLAAALVKRAVQDLLISTKFLVEEKDTLEQMSLQNYIEQYGSRRTDPLVRPRRAASLADSVSSVGTTASTWHPPPPPPSHPPHQLPALHHGHPTTPSDAYASIPAPGAHPASQYPRDHDAAEPWSAAAAAEGPPRAPWHAQDMHHASPPRRGPDGPAVAETGGLSQAGPPLLPTRPAPATATATATAPPAPPPVVVMTPPGPGRLVSASPSAAEGATQRLSSGLAPLGAPMATLPEGAVSDETGSTTLAAASSASSTGSLMLLPDGAASASASSLDLDGRERHSASGLSDEALLEYDYAPQEIVFTVQDGNKVKGGTLRALVERLTLHDALDPSFTTCFLLTYRSFTSTPALFRLLVSRFQIAPPAGLTRAQAEVWRARKQTPIRIRVFHVLKSWLEQYCLDEPDDLAVLSEIRDFADQAMRAAGMEAAANALIRIVEQRQVLPGVFRRAVQATPQPLPAPILPRNLRKFRLTDLDPLELARQLTLMESAEYNKITPQEFLNKNWSNKRPGASPNIKTMSRLSNQIIGWVALTILAEKDPKRRAPVVKHLILVGDRCRMLNNFNTLMSILAGLNSAPIHRLKRTFELLSARVQAILDVLRDTMAPHRNFSTYRDTLHAVTPPCVPFLGFYLTDLTFIEDGNPDFLKGGELINFGKRLKTSDVIREVQQYQTTPYAVAPVPEIQQWLLQQFDQSTDDNALYEMSLLLEPRERDDEKITRLLQESGFL